MTNRCNEEVRKALASAGLTQWNFAEIVGVSEAYMSKKMCRAEMSSAAKDAAISIIKSVDEGQIPRAIDISNFLKESSTNEQLNKKRAIAERKKINRILDEIREKRVLGEWGL